MNRLRLLLSLLSLAGLFLGLIPGALGAPEVGTGDMGPAGPVVVRFYFADRDALGAVAGELDLWEVHHDRGYAVAAVSPEEFLWLQGLGYRLEIDQERTALLSRRNEPLPGQVDGIPGYPCYRTVEETYTSMSSLATNYPSLAELYDIGDSWEKVMPGGADGYDIYALRITNENITPIDTKPTFFLMAEIHAREYTTAETAMRFAEYLLQNYGTNPEITFFVDYYRIYVVPMTNPDGRKLAEQGQLWRKNTDNDDGCNDPFSWGTDLNRNHSFKWGCCGGSSGNPCSAIYRGPSPASEPETQAIQSTVLGLFPDQRGPGDNDPAPADATGILITLHSYSELVLWPWGWTYGGAPNETQLQTIGRKLAWYNNYTPQQSSDLYITDGTTDDWSYGELGIASFTFELGTAFFQSCSTFENTIWPNNRPALLYAFTVAKTPYMTAYGPDSLNAATNPPSVPRGQPVQLTATINDTRRRYDPAQNIAAAEYFVLPLHGSTPPGDPGTGIPMAPQDGSWNSSIENVIATVDTSGLTPGDYIIALRGKDAQNNWGPFTAVFLTVTPPLQCEPVEILGVYTSTAGCTVSFSAELSGTAPFAYAWDFGPFGSSSQPSPTVNLTPGTHPYSLTVSNCSGQHTDTFSGVVTVDCCVPPENASFVYAPALPVAGEPTVFTGTAESNRPLSFTWSFGDGQYGSGNPVGHTYGAGGDYTVRMTTTSECGSTTAQETVGVCGPASNASFTWTPMTPTEGQWVYFHGQGVGTPPLSYTWDFGDGGRGSGANVSHRYNEAGEYTVVMTLTNACGRQVVSHVLVVVPVQPPCDPVHDAAFTWEPAFPYAGEVVTFTGGAAGDAPITYTWDLGDGTDAEGAVVAHTYATSGTYTVVMTATNCGTRTAVVSHTVQVLAPGVCIPAHHAVISFAPDTPLIFRPVLFTATVSGDAPFTCTWSFGDGGGSSGFPTATHAYGLPGAYTVAVTVTNCGGSGLATASRILEVGAYRIYLPIVLRSQ